MTSAWSTRNECRNMACTKETSYLVTWPDGRTVETCSTHLRWIIDMILSNCPEHMADIGIQRRRPPTRRKGNGRIRFSVSLTVNEEEWRSEYGPNGSVEEDVRSYVLNELQSGPVGSEGLWTDIDVK